MKKVRLKRFNRVCSRRLGGCGRTIFKEEEAWLQIRRKKPNEYLCDKCYEKVVVNAD